MMKGKITEVDSFLIIETQTCESMYSESLTEWFSMTLMVIVSYSNSNAALLHPLGSAASFKSPLVGFRRR